MKKIMIFIFIITLSVLITSCSEDWYTIYPQGEASFSTLQTKQGVELLLVGAYAVIDGVSIGGRKPQGWPSAVSNWVWGSVRGGDAYKGSNFGDQNEINDIAGFYATPANSPVADHWQILYEAVVRTNDVLKAVEDATGMTENEKLLVKAQAKFLRAHYYVELTKIHGKVPFINENTINPTIVPNDHILWPEIEDDMQFAVDFLPATWTDKGRPTKWAAKTYLAQIYLLQGNFTEAMPLLKDVYDNGPFQLAPQFNHNFLIATVNNSESIFEIQYAVNSAVGTHFLANAGDALNACSFKSSSNFHQPSHNLVSAFRVNTDGLPLEPDPSSYDISDIIPYDPTGATVPYTLPIDPRLDWSVARPGVPDYDWGIPNVTWIRDPGNGGPYMFKKSTFLKSEKHIYSSTTGRPGANANNYRKFKLSHVILWLAECEAEAGNLHEATLLVNEIRTRVKNSDVVRFDNGTPAANYLIELYPEDFSTIEAARLAIRHEERLEFAGEGNRFFDLVRWGIVSPVMNTYFEVEGTVMTQLAGKKFVAGQHEVVPIPQNEIDLSFDGDGNPVLTQNPGY